MARHLGQVGFFRIVDFIRSMDAVREFDTMTDASAWVAKKLSIPGINPRAMKRAVELAGESGKIVIAQRNVGRSMVATAFDNIKALENRIAILEVWAESMNGSPLNDNVPVKRA